MRNTTSLLLIAPALLSIVMAQAPKTDDPKSRTTDKPLTLSAVTGCLTKVDGSYLLKNDSGDRFTVSGTSELEKHINHKVTLRGVEGTENAKMTFKADQVEMISTDCSSK